MLSAHDAAAARRGRKRGKHNFEPGYKELLFKEWSSFSEKFARCPKPEEIDKFSRASFERRQRELAEEDPDHPLLVILDAPLDAIQVKNLINNEKKKRHRASPAASNQAPGAFPFAALQGLALEDAARVMKGWLENTGSQQDHSNEHPPASPAPSTSNATHTTPRRHDLAGRRMSFVSEASCEGATGLLPRPDVTPQSQPRVINRSVGRMLNFSLDSHSDEESDDTHSVERKGALTSPCSTANFSTMTTSEAEEPNTSSKLDMAKVIQSTAAEAISLSLLHQSHAEATFQSTPTQLLASTTPPATVNVQPEATTDLAESIASVAATACNQALAGMLAGSAPVNLFRIQEMVKEVVDEKVRNLASQQRAQIFKQQQQEQQTPPTVAQFWQVMQLMQGLQNRQ